MRFHRCSSRRRSFSVAFLISLLVRDIARCDGADVVYPSSSSAAAFVVRRSSFVPRGGGRGGRRLQLQDEPYCDDATSEPSSEPRCHHHRNDNSNRRRPSKESYLPDRRACLVHIGAGGAVMTAASASAEGSTKNSRNNSMSTSISSPIGDNNLRSDDEARDDASPAVTITLPLEPASGGTFCVRLTVFASEDESSTGRSFWGGGMRNNNLEEDTFRVYRAIVDTGSPYLVLPSSILPRDRRWNIRQWVGLLTREMEHDELRLSASEYPPTEEIYGAVKGEINWKLAAYMFRDPRLRTLSENGDGCRHRHTSSSSSSLANSVPNTPMGVVGVLDEALTDEATGGGAFEPYALLGLIRNNNPNADRGRFPDPRPSFLEQERIISPSSADRYDGDDDTLVAKHAVESDEQYPIKAFSIDGHRRELTLSTRPLIPATAPAMPLVDLRTYGDFVDHYAVVADFVSFDGISVSSRRLKDFTGSKIERPIVAVFDTGLTGCLLIRPFWDVVQNYLGAIKCIDKPDQFQSVSLSLGESQRQLPHNGSSFCKMMSSREEDRRFYGQPIDLDWFDNEQYSPYVIVLGQTFLARGALTIDMDERMATFSTANSS